VPEVVDSNGLVVDLNLLEVAALLHGLIIFELLQEQFIQYILE
jgi:hypothetical protein